ncbi:MAG: hypothetical protein WD490_03535 [Opitutales bacterium]
MKTTIISLVGGQPEPPFHGQRHLGSHHSDPVGTILVSSQSTTIVAKRILRALSITNESNSLWNECPPYDVEAAFAYLNEKNASLGSGHEIVWDITGGTKPMVLAATMIAQSTDATMAYLESELGTCYIYRYGFQRNSSDIRKIDKQECCSQLTLDLYFTLHGHDVKERTSKQDNQGKQYEDLIEAQLKKIAGIEFRRGVAKGNLDIDFVVRRGNQVAVIEAKSGGGSKKGIDQLNTASQRDRFGTYIKKGLIHGQSLDQNNVDLAEASSIRACLLEPGESAPSSIVKDFINSKLFQ